MGFFNPTTSEIRHKISATEGCGTNEACHKVHAALTLRRVNLFFCLITRALFLNSPKAFDFRR